MTATDSVSSTPRENLQQLLLGGRPTWVPFSLNVGAIPGFTAPIQRRFQEATGKDDPDEFFQTDWRLFSLTARFGGDDPAALHTAIEPGTTFDEWGIGHLAAGPEGTLDKTYPPLAQARSVKEIDVFPLPVIEPSHDTSRVEGCHAAGYPVFGYAGSIYEWAWWLRGMEQFMVDLVHDPALAEAVLRKVETHTTRLALATAGAGVDVLCFYDDVGMQRGMQIAPALWRQYVKPVWQRVLETVRGRFPQAAFFLHCCGKIEAILPDVVELGFHVLHPIQPECMDFEDVYHRFGSRIVAAATLSAQRTFPFGSAADVRREVHRLADIAADHRTILMPSNRIQPETPWENVVAFAEACRSLR
jgi:uroporphyrinogen decarboxylase